MTTTSKKDYKEYKRWSQSGLDRIGKEGKDKMLEVYSKEMDRVNKEDEQGKITHVKHLFSQRDLLNRGKNTEKLHDVVIRKLGLLPYNRPKNNKGYIRLYKRLYKPAPTKKPSK